jgi:hypothetical protein
VSIILFVLFLCWERYLERRDGSIPPAAKFSLFTRNRYRFTFVLLASFFAFMGAAGWVYCATIFYQNVKGDSALMNAVHLLPCNLLGIVAGVSVSVASAPACEALGSRPDLRSSSSCIFPPVSAHRSSSWAARSSQGGSHGGFGALTRQGVFSDLRGCFPRCQLLGYGVRGTIVATLGHRLVS